MVLPAQFENDVHAGDKILFCPYCSRILYYEDADSPALFFNEDNAGGLSDIVDFEEEYDEEVNDYRRVTAVHWREESPGSEEHDAG